MIATVRKYTCLFPPPHPSHPLLHLNYPSNHPYLSKSNKYIKVLKSCKNLPTLQWILTCAWKTWPVNLACLTFSSIYTHFSTLMEKTLGKHRGKR